MWPVHILIAESRTDAEAQPMTHTHPRRNGNSQRPKHSFSDARMFETPEQTTSMILMLMNTDNQTKHVITTITLFTRPILFRRQSTCRGKVLLSFLIAARRSLPVPCPEPAPGLIS
jgi:hypothetical protein